VRGPPRALRSFQRRVRCERVMERMSEAAGWQRRLRSGWRRDRRLPGAAGVARDPLLWHRDPQPDGRERGTLKRSGSLHQPDTGQDTRESRRRRDGEPAGAQPAAVPTHPVSLTRPILL